MEYELTINTHPEILKAELKEACRELTALNNGEYDLSEEELNETRLTILCDIQGLSDLLEAQKERRIA